MKEGRTLYVYRLAKIKFTSFFVTFISVTIFSGLIFATSSFLIELSEVKSVAKRINEDISLKNQKWNLFYLNSDPVLPGGESHYIIASDGFIVERWRPVNGLLDTARLSYILNFSNLETVSTPSNEKWRVLSSPIYADSEIIGAIFVSSYINEGSDLKIIDERIAKDMAYVKKFITVVNDKIDVSKLDLRGTHYDVSIKVVDKFNQILTKSNNSNAIERAPIYIDASYLRYFLEKDKVFIHFDGFEPYLVVSKIVEDQVKEDKGVIVVARSLASNIKILSQYFGSMLLIFAIVILGHSIIDSKFGTGKMIDDIKFLIDDGVLKINKNEIVIYKETIQYQLIKVLFANPKKEFNYSEIIINENKEPESHQWKSVYDAVVVVNRKTEKYLSKKLIKVANKKFYIDKSFQKKVKIEF